MKIVALFILLSVCFVYAPDPNAICHPKCSTKDYRETTFNGAKRNATLNCIMTAIDSNKNGYITEREFQAFSARELNDFERPLAMWSVLYGQCACDCDNQIGMNDLIASWRTCLSTNFEIEGAWDRLCAQHDPNNLPPARSM